MPYEGVAASLLETLGMDDPPVDCREIAALCGLRLVPTIGGGESLCGDVLRYDATARPTRQQGLLAHGLGHFAIAWAGERDSEEGADAVGAAILLPRRAFERDLRETWDLCELQRRHPNASYELIARRIVGLRPATAAIWDHAKLKRRVTSVRGLAKTRPLERHLAAQALASGEIVQEGRAWAYPVLDGPWRRVVVLVDEES